MRFFLLFICGFLGVFSAAAEEIAAVPAKDAEGYLQLFNGKDLTGWKIVGKKQDFAVNDGVIRCDQGGGGLWMYYAGQQFSDFELVVEWRVSPGGNSGVFLRVPPKGAPWDTGYEVQISNEQPPRDDIHCTGALYGYVPVDPRPDETPGQWRKYEITCRGSHISVKVDGQQVVSFDQTTKVETKDKPLTGFIGVQDSHGPKGTWIEYRTIKLKPLD